MTDSNRRDDHRMQSPRIINIENLRNAALRRLPKRRAS